MPELVTELGFNGSWEALAVQGAIVLCAVVWLAMQRTRPVAGVAARPQVSA